MSSDLRLAVATAALTAAPLALARATTTAAVAVAGPASTESLPWLVQQQHPPMAEEMRLHRLCGVP